jgi:hypothetical protein
MLLDSINKTLNISYQFLKKLIKMRMELLIETSSYKLSIVVEKKLTHKFYLIILIHLTMIK